MDTENGQMSIVNTGELREARYEHSDPMWTSEAPNEHREGANAISKFVKWWAGAKVDICLDRVSRHLVELVGNIVGTVISNEKRCR